MFIDRVVVRVKAGNGGSGIASFRREKFVPMEGRDGGSGERIGESIEAGQELRVARGGRGGKGNSHFATATHQTPLEYQPGEDGDARTLELELKLIADVGLVGQPNAGKSTLLSIISAAHPKIGDYPFTTLAPNLGVVQLSDDRTFVGAELPRLTE